MVDQTVDAVRMEVGEDGYYDGFVGVHGKEGDRPAGDILRAEGYLVPLLDSEGGEYEVELDYFGGEVRVGEHFAVIIAERRPVPTGLHAAFESCKIMFHKFGD